MFVQSGLHGILQTDEWCCRCGPCISRTVGMLARSRRVIGKLARGRAKDRRRMGICLVAIVRIMVFQILVVVGKIIIGVN